MKAPRHWNVQKSFGNYLGDRARAAPQNSGDGEAEDAAASGISAVGDGETGTRMRRQVELARLVMVKPGRGRLLRPPGVGEQMDGAQGRGDRLRRAFMLLILYPRI